MVEGLAPPTRAVVHSHDTICRRHKYIILLDMHFFKFAITGNTIINSENIQNNMIIIDTHIFVKHI